MPRKTAPSAHTPAPTRPASMRPRPDAAENAIQERLLRDGEAALQ